MIHPDSFSRRHIGPSATETEEMLATIGVNSLDELIDQTIPASIRLPEAPAVGEALPEHVYLAELREIAAQNEVFKSYIGLGYYPCVTPSVILRNIFENPGWYTQYTPYQAEIAQGRLESLLNFQTMVCDLTGLPVANASLLDEGTAAAEAMSMTHGQKSRKLRNAKADVLLVSDKVFPQTLDVLRTRAGGVGIELKVVDFSTVSPADVVADDVFAAIAQYPDMTGALTDLRPLADALHAKGSYLIVATDLLALTLITEPAALGADVVLGSAQRLGVPMGFGGPHAAFFAAKDEFLRQMPGRIIGISVDASGQPALRMTLQTREQHIRRDKATSNICTAQALLANMAAMYAVWHGPDGLSEIASHIRHLVSVLYAGLQQLGVKVVNDTFFDTLTLDLGDEQTVATLREFAHESGINFRYDGNGLVGVSVSEITELDDVMEILYLVADAIEDETEEMAIGDEVIALPELFARTSDFLTHPVFNSYHSETAMMRYIKSLENKDLSLNTAMIPLGSCTMKLNAATEMIPVSWPEFAQIHPFAPEEQWQGYRQIIDDLASDLAALTGFAGISFQPNSGAQGEYTGLMVIRAYHHSRGDHHRNVALIPASAHGTNPASAVMAGMQVVVTKTAADGTIDMDDLRAKAAQYKDSLSCLMVTYPSTHGVFEETIREICELIHSYGGQVYMDGANMNAQVGLTSPGFIGADVCHLNLHKTFAIPHGGGGPGVGPIGVADHLVPFLPGHALVQTGGKQAISAVSASPFGSASILLISYGYIKMLGTNGLADATRYAVLNANYMAARLREHYPILYTGSNGFVAHEFILDVRELKDLAGITPDDFAKRLMDYGFHAPTMSWPVAGTLMVEPTESEPKSEMDRFCDAMIAIRQEVQEIADGKADAHDNVLHNAPHTLAEVTADEWTHPYSRQKAAFPLANIGAAGKFWPSVKRVDNTYGDRNVVCTCPPVESYAMA